MFRFVLDLLGDGKGVVSIANGSSTEPFREWLEGSPPEFARDDVMSGYCDQRDMVVWICIHT